jgi:hypothetical protein
LGKQPPEIDRNAPTFHNQQYSTCTTRRQNNIAKPKDKAEFQKH